MRSYAYPFAALFLILVTEAAPVAARTPGACAQGRPEFSIGYVEAFAHPIDDRDLLLMIDGLTHQEGIFTRPFHLMPGADPITLPPPSGPDPVCRLPQVSYAVARTMKMAMIKWSLRQDELDALIPRLETAFEALARRDELESRTIDAALRPFGFTFSEFRGPRRILDVCDQSGGNEARNTDVNVGRLFVKNVPLTAHLRVRVDLTDEALVRDVEILSNTAAGTPLADEIAVDTLDTGAAASYVTACTNGRPRAASFIYSADYK